MPDAAMALLQCYREAGVPLEPGQGGPCDLPPSHGAMATAGSGEEGEGGEVGREFQLYVCEVLQQL